MARLGLWEAQDRDYPGLMSRAMLNKAKLVPAVLYWVSASGTEPWQQRCGEWRQWSPGVWSTQRNPQDAITITITGCYLCNSNTPFLYYLCSSASHLFSCVSGQPHTGFIYELSCGQIFMLMQD